MLKGKCWDTSDQIQQAVLQGVLKDTNFALVLTAPARLHCYLLEKAQFGLLKPVLTQRLPGFFCPLIIIYIYSWSVKDTVKVPWLLKKKKKGNHWGFCWGSPAHHSPLCSHSVCQGAVGIQAKPQHTALESLFVLRFMCFHFYVQHTCLVSVVVANGKWI